MNWNSDSISIAGGELVKVYASAFFVWIRLKGVAIFLYKNVTKNIDKFKIHAKIRLLKFKLIFSIKFKIKKIKIK